MPEQLSVLIIGEAELGLMIGRCLAEEGRVERLYVFGANPIHEEMGWGNMSPVKKSISRSSCLEDGCFDVLICVSSMGFARRSMGTRIGGKNTQPTGLGLCEVILGLKDFLVDETLVLVVDSCAQTDVYAPTSEVGESVLEIPYGEYTSSPPQRFLLRYVAVGGSLDHHDIFGEIKRHLEGWDASHNLPLAV